MVRQNQFSSVLSPYSASLFSGLTAFLVLFLGFIFEFYFILKMNHGTFVYTLDDPYIHLALAENIARFHYGVNLLEFSSPSSSILWPILLAPFASFGFGVYMPLLINMLAASLTLFFYWKILNNVLVFPSAALKNTVLTVVLIALIFATNLIGLVFNGLEHSVHVLLGVVVVSGLIEIAGENKKNHQSLTLNSLLFLSIILLPLIRYEGLAISVPAMIFLFMKGYRLPVVFSALIIAFCIGLFSWFLISLGLDAMPASILAKSKVVLSGGSFETIGLKFLENTAYPRFPISLHLVALMLLLGFTFNKKAVFDDRVLAALFSFALLLHYLFGDFGWYRRYEIYIWASVLLVLIYLARNIITAVVPQAKGGAFALVLIFTIMVLAPYIACVTSTPVASNNIYQQQYQMHRFAVEYYKKPIAVNDLGYVSYRNDEYILDLWGLASTKALKQLVATRELKAQMKAQGLPFDEQKSVAWMTHLAEENQVKFAMLYEDGFSSLPAQWIKVAELRLSREKITPAFDVVAFYALDATTRDETRDALKEFKASLPGEIIFNFL